MTPDKNPEMAPQAMAAAKRRKERQHTIFQSWLGQHAADMAAKPEDLRRAIMVFIMEQSHVAAARGEDGLRIPRTDWDKMMRQFICQTRAQRFGPVMFLDENEWRQQIATLCAEYNWAWVEPPAPQIARAA